MRRNWLAAAALLGAITFVACERIPPPAATAAAVERSQCDPSVTAPEAIQLLRANAVLAVKPIYRHIIVNPNNAEDRAGGAKLLLRPPNGITTEQMTRILQCHSARVLLGRVSPAEVPEDPYWLADTWLDIEVTSENGNFAVTIEAPSVDDNIEVLRRAERYARDHMLAMYVAP